MPFRSTLVNIGVIVFGVLALLLPGSLSAQDAGHGEPDLVPIPEVVTRGEGAVTLLLIPCMSCRWNAWEEFMVRNQDRYTMIAVTLPGFGGTPVPGFPRNTGGTQWRDNAIAALSEVIDERGLSDLTVVGHSWGNMVGVQLAAARPDAITRLVAVDGDIESDSWTPDNRDEQLRQSRQVHEEWGAKLSDAEEWRRFNGVGLPAGDMVTREDAARAMRLHGGFMATPREVVLQYWSENPLIDLTGAMHKITAPILNIRPLRGDDQSVKREQHLADLAAADTPGTVQTVFLYDTRHFVMFHRPEVLDRLIADFLAGREVGDFVPAESQ